MSAGDKSSSSPASKQQPVADAWQVAIKLCGVLRNLAVPKEQAQGFGAAGALPAFKSVLQQLGHLKELAVNLTAVLYKLTLIDSIQV
jgi:hypothetical protein